jgi:hypothetical protein
MSEEEFMNYIKEILIKKLCIKKYEDNISKQLEENISILKDRKKEFFIEI